MTGGRTGTEHVSSAFCHLHITTGGTIMGFLKKLFEKKDCEICGGEIGLLGNKKLVDGDCCKDCAAKLSPWFTERKESTVAEIKEQLAYREANAA